MVKADHIVTIRTSSEVLISCDICLPYKTGVVWGRPRQTHGIPDVHLPWLFVLHI